MSSKKPQISVVMPAYNAERYIARAIESVLNQTFRNFELIIINDVSSDKTPSIIKEYQEKDSRVRMINNRKKGLIAGSLNKGIKLARADVIARMDADDVCYPRRLEVQYKLLMKKPEVAVVGANMRIVDEKGKIISKREYPKKSKELKRLMFRYSPFAHPVVMYRKSVFKEFGGYVENIFPCEDIDLWFKIGSKYQFASVSKPLLKYTLYSTSSSHKKVKDVELLGLKVKIDALKKYDYKLSVFDIFFNLIQYITLWFMPATFRIRLFNFLRSHWLI